MLRCVPAIRVVLAGESTEWQEQCENLHRRYLEVIESSGTPVNERRSILHMRAQKSNKRVSMLQEPSDPPIAYTQSPYSELSGQEYGVPVK